MTRRDAHVLVVADLEADALAAEQLLAEAGYDNVDVRIGTDGLIRDYLTLRPEVVVLDLFTDITGGAGVIQQLRSAGWGGTEVPFMIVTDDVTSEHTQVAVDAGARTAIDRSKLASRLASEVSSALSNRDLAASLKREREQHIESLLADRTVDLASAQVA